MGMEILEVTVLLVADLNMPVYCGKQIERLRPAMLVLSWELVPKGFSAKVMSPSARIYMRVLMLIIRNSPMMKYSNLPKFILEYLARTGLALNQTPCHKPRTEPPRNKLYHPATSAM
jgi:hypothetical protein